MDMADWARKHLNDLICAVKATHRDDSISPAHQDQLRKVCELGNPLKSGSWGEGTAADVMEIVTVLCSVCKEVGRYQCEGRSSWQLPCAFIADSKQ